MTSNDAARPDLEEQLRLNQQVIDDFRTHAGEASTGRFVGTPLLLLTTRGVKSGKQRTTPLAYTRDGERYVVIASNGGSARHPAWYLNVVAQPAVRVEIGTDAFDARATVASEPERSRLYARQAALMPNFARHAAATSRTIPVVILKPQSRQRDNLRHSQYDRRLAYMPSTHSNVIGATGA
jgi:deazaflavin-dependent oxidoreductase (nitroreductase family)